jgi:hypothetical protein
MAELACKRRGHRSQDEPAGVPNGSGSLVPAVPKRSAMCCHHCGSKNVVRLPYKPKQ